MEVVRCASIKSKILDLKKQRSYLRVLTIKLQNKSFTRATYLATLRLHTYNMYVDFRIKQQSGRFSHRITHQTARVCNNIPHVGTFKPVPREKKSVQH